MRRILLPWMFDVVDAIDELSAINSGSRLDGNWYLLFNAKNQLEALFNQSVYSPHLRISRQKADELYSQIDSILGSDVSQNERLLTDAEVWLLKYRRDHFKTVLLSELSTLPAFLVAEKESYDINIMIDDGARLFPQTLAAKAPEAVRDAREVGKAIAFELSTAAGFHIFRIVEAVLKRYWDQVSSGKERPKLETIGNYASELERSSFGDSKVFESLKQLSRLHRNPLIHPEVILDVGEAIETLGISRSVVGAMLRVLPDVPPTTASAEISP